MMSPDAYIEICEEPASKWKRLRYKSEGRNRNCRSSLPPPIEGVRTSPRKKTFPSLRIMNYTGRATIIVSTVTANSPCRHHPHNLVGLNCKDGIYRHDFYTDSSHPKILLFTDLRIERCLVWEIPVRIMERNSLDIDPFQLREQQDNMQRDIHSLRLCFQVFLRPCPADPKFTVELQPKVSQPIFNKKVASTITIFDISDICSPASGGKKIMIFCNRVDKKDIRIRFFEEDAQQRETWIGWGVFWPHNVHADVAFAFRTPKYEGILDGKPKSIFMEMVTRSGDVRSDRMSFQFVPDVTNIDVAMMEKREKIDASEKFFESLSTLPQHNILSDVQVRPDQNPPQQPLYQHIPPEQPIPPHQHISTTHIQNIPCQWNSVQHNIVPQQSFSLQQRPEQYIPQGQFNAREHGTQARLNFAEQDYTDEFCQFDWPT